MVTNDKNEKKLTYEDLKKMTKEQIMERIEEVREVLYEHYKKQKGGAVE